MKQNLPDSIFIEKDPNKKCEDIGVNFPFDTDMIVSIRQGLSETEEGDIVFKNPPMMRRIQMYDNTTNKMVAEWEEPIGE